MEMTREATRACTTRDVNKHVSKQSLIVGFDYSNSSRDLEKYRRLMRFRFFFPPRIIMIII